MNKLFLKLSAIILALLLVVGTAYVMVSSYISEDYVSEVNQRLYGGIAEHMVHEIKPLVNGAVDTATIQGFVETLIMKTEQMPPEDRKRHLQTIYNSSERLSGLISQLFEYSKLEARQIEPAKEAFSVGELAQDVAHKFSVLAACIFHPN